jgi:Flp pilus assembly protein TadG
VKSTTNNVWHHSRSRQRGSQAVELAVVLPFLLVLSVGIFDFGAAYNLKQKLNNAAREGVRFGINESTLDLTMTNPASVQAIRDVVFNYVNDAKVVGPTCSGPTNGTGPSVFEWTYTYSGCPGTLTLDINRSYDYNATINGTSVVVTATRVKVSYTYNWFFGNVAPLVARGAKYTLPNPISSYAVAPNLF